MTGPRIAEVTADDVAALAAGTAVFGTGGGGGTYTSRVVVEQALRERGPVRLVTVDELTPEDVVILMSGIGAPTVGIEMLPAQEQAATEALAGRWPVAIEKDTVVYTSDEIDATTAWPGKPAHYGRGLGQFKYEGSAPLETHARFLTGTGPYEGKSDLEELI